MGKVASISRGEAAQGQRWPGRKPVADVRSGAARVVPGSDRPAEAARLSGGQRQGTLARRLASLAPGFVDQISPSQLGTVLADLSILCTTAIAVAPRLAPASHLRTTAAYVVMMLAIMTQEGLYRERRHRDEDHFLLGKASLGAFLLAVLLSSRNPRGAAATGLLGIVSYCLLLSWRWLWKRVTGAKAIPEVNVLIVGSPSAMQRAANAIREESPHSRVKALVPDWQIRDMRDHASLSRIAREDHIDEVVIAGGDPAFVASLVAQCSRNALDVVIVPEIPGGEALAAENLAGVPLIRVLEQGRPKWALAFKRVVDVCLGGFAAILALPFMGMIALAIKLDSRGPALYRSQRVGRRGVRFACYKFRTMRPDAEGKKRELRSRNERWGAFFKMHGDPRVTRVGHWLRRYSLDELPQLWNVLRGEMSLVGPRPHPVDDVERYELEDMQRLDFTPGMTGLWQVVARNDPSFKRCVALDVEYIRNWSLLLDLRVLSRTAAVVLRGSGA